MGKLEKMLKKHAGSMDVPDTYKAKVEKTFINILQNGGERGHGKKMFYRTRQFRIAVVVLALLVVVITVTDRTVDANIFGSFRQTIMDFLHTGEKGEGECKGVKSVEEQQLSKPDLMVELQELVIDKSNIYLLVKIIAPTNITFNEKIKFDYLVFVRGTNYDADQIIPGVVDCSLQKVNPGRENEATYVVRLSPEEEIEKGSMVTAYFKDLMADPDGSGREMLVEGMWSVPFEINHFT